MRTNWGKAFLWSTMGGAAVGVAVVLAGSRRRRVTPMLRCQRVPEGCSHVVLWTESFRMGDEGGAHTFHDTYILQVTGFKLWRVLELPSEPGQSGVEGAAIYHVTHLRACDSIEAGETAESLVDRYYATVALLDQHGKPCGRNRLARGGVLELAECLVGGTSNGVETGKVRRSTAPILNYRFEYSQGGMQFHEPPARAS